MTIAYANRCLQTTLTAGTSSYALGAAPTGYQTIVAGVGSGKKVPYFATDDVDWEAGIGTITAGSPDTLSRDTILGSSNSGAAVNWGSNQKMVHLTAIAELFAGRDEKMNFVEGIAASVGGTANAQTITRAVPSRGYTDGQVFAWYSVGDTTGSVTVNDSAQGAKTLKWRGANLGSGAFKTGDLIAGRYRASTDAIEIMVTPRTELGITPAAMKGRILNGLTLSNNASDATNDIDIAAGSVVSDDGTTVMTLAAGITKRLDAAWAVGSANGGLDTGSIADTTYHLWAIHRPDTGVTDVLFSTSASGPTTPANYTKKRRIGSVMRESGALVAFDQKGAKFLRKDRAVGFSLSSLATSKSNLTLPVPTGIVCEVQFSVFIEQGGNALNVIFFSAGDSDRAPSSTDNDLSIGSTSPPIQNVEICRRTDALARIAYRSNNANITRLVGRVFGWTDYDLA